MIYVERRPPPDLAPEIECLWSLRGPGVASAEPQAVYPDGCAEWIVHVADPFAELDERGGWIAQPRTFLMGPSTRPLFLSSGRDVDTVGIRFRPGAVSRFLAPAAVLAERATPGDALLGADASRLAERLAEAPDGATRFDELVRFLRDLRRARTAEWIAPAVRSILAAEGRVPIASLARACGLGARTMQRGFRAHVGLSPKAFARIVRFQGVFRRLGADDAPDWIQVALDSGFFDQSHLIRDFKRLAGVTPDQHHRAARSLARHFTSGQRLAAYFGSE